MKGAFLILLLVMSVMIIGLVSAVGNSGATWTTNNDCGTIHQDVNQYAVGDQVYINGAGFAAGTYNWTITGQPGGASSDPGIVVANGTTTVDSTGKFCIDAYTVQPGDYGEYKASFNDKQDNYRVNGIIQEVPEFGTFAGILTLLGSVGIFFFVRRR